MELAEGSRVERAALLRTARPLMRGEALIAGAVWSGKG
jgi:hypothetical protein